MSLPATLYDPDGLAVRFLILNSSGRQVDLSAAPRILTGADAPTSTAYPAGSLYLRTNGGIYAYNGSAWLPLLEERSGGFREISSLPATVAAADEAILVTATGTLALPAPSAGRRRLSIRARGGAVTLTPASGQIEDFTGALGSSLVLSDGSGACLRSTDSAWIIFPG